MTSHRGGRRHLPQSCELLAWRPRGLLSACDVVIQRTLESWTVSSRSALKSHCWVCSVRGVLRVGIRFGGSQSWYSGKRLEDDSREALSVR